MYQTISFILTLSLPLLIPGCGNLLAAGSPGRQVAVLASRFTAEPHEPPPPTDGCHRRREPRLEPRGSYSLHRLLKFLMPGPFLRLVTASLMFIYLRQAKQTDSSELIPPHWPSAGSSSRTDLGAPSPVSQSVSLPHCLSVCSSSHAPISTGEVRVRRVQRGVVEGGRGRVHPLLLPYPPPLLRCVHLQAEKNLTIKEEIIAAMSWVFLC